MIFSTKKYVFVISTPPKILPAPKLKAQLIGLVCQKEPTRCFSFPYWCYHALRVHHLPCLTLYVHSIFLEKEVIQVEKWFGFSLPEGDQNVLLLPNFPWKVVRVYRKVNREREGVVFFPLHNANSGEEGRCQAAPVQILAHNHQKATSALILCFCYVFNCYWFLGNLYFSKMNMYPSTMLKKFSISSKKLLCAYDSNAVFYTAKIPF